MSHYSWQHTATHCNTLQHTATHCNAQNRDPELRGWKFNPPPESPDKNTLVIMAHGAGRDRRAWLRFFFVFTI